jgi:hypothetical protein
MEGNTMQIRAYEGKLPISSRVRIEMNQSDNNGNETTYWGVLCRSCVELVAFDICPYLSFGPGAANAHPGAIRCAHGHNHIYFPRDFQFFYSDVSIDDAVMQGNREAYRAIDPLSQALSNPPDGWEVINKSDARSS